MPTMIDPETAGCAPDFTAHANDCASSAKWYTDVLAMLVNMLSDDCYRVEDLFRDLCKLAEELHGDTELGDLLIPRN